MSDLANQIEKACQNHKSLMAGHKVDAVGFFNYLQANVPLTPQQAVSVINGGFNMEAIRLKFYITRNFAGGRSSTTEGAAFRLNNTYKDDNCIGVEQYVYL